MHVLGCPCSPSERCSLFDKMSYSNAKFRLVPSTGSLHFHGLNKCRLLRFPCRPSLPRSIRLEKCSRTNYVTASHSDSFRETSSQPILRGFGPRSIAVSSILLAMFLHNPPAIAMDSLAVESISSKVRHVLSFAWPKILSVMVVIKDQGIPLTILLGLSAFFSMAETSITTLWPWKVRELAEKEGEAGVFNRLRKDVTRFLTTILIGTTVVNIAATALVTDAVTSLFGEAGISTATAIMTALQLILTEITPKSFAAHNAIPVARLVIQPIALLSFILYPIGKACTTLSMFILKLLHLKSSGEPIISEEELKLVLRGAELSGIIEEEEQNMIENVLEIKDTYVRDLMTPLVDIVAIDAHDSWIDFANLWENYQYSRVPVFEGRVDNIIGIAYAKDIIHYVQEGKLLPGVTKSKITHRPPFFVPDSMSAWDILREFTIRKVHMAIVLNEYGGTIGLVTLEDVVEEIVGEIFDENDSKEEIRKRTGYVIQRGEGVFDVDANTSIEDFCDALNLVIPEGPYETVSGFVCYEFGCIPRMGDFKNVKLRRYIENSDEESKGENDEVVLSEEGLFSSYCMKILAGTARKVSIVRFELLKDSTSNPIPPVKQLKAKPTQSKLGSEAAYSNSTKEEKKRKEFIWDWRDSNEYPKTSPSPTALPPSPSSFIGFSDEESNGYGQRKNGECSFHPYDVQGHEELVEDDKRKEVMDTNYWGTTSGRFGDDVSNFDYGEGREESERDGYPRSRDSEASEIPFAKVIHGGEEGEDIMNGMLLRDENTADYIIHPVEMNENQVEDGILPKEKTPNGTDVGKEEKAIPPIGGIQDEAEKGISNDKPDASSSQQSYSERNTNYSNNRNSS